MAHIGAIGLHMPRRGGIGHLQIDVLDELVDLLRSHDADQRFDSTVEVAVHQIGGTNPHFRTGRRAFADLRAGDSSAREMLIRHNLRLVAHIAKKYYALPSEQDDLISIGTIGLMKAVDTFDSTRRARFSTYASRCIENAILSQAHFQMEKRTHSFCKAA